MRERIRLKIEKPDSKRERDADLAAERIMSGKKIIQRKSAKKSSGGVISHEEAISLLDGMIEEKREATQRLEKAGSKSSGAIDLKSFGEPLSEKERKFFEPAFNRDFSDVRIHTDADSAKIAEELNARAFTAVNDIVFGKGEYSPDTEEGKRLLAHELVHVTQKENNNIALLKGGQNKKATKTDNLPNFLSAQILLEYQPSTIKGKVEWILDAVEEKFVTFAYNFIKDDLVDIQMELGNDDNNKKIEIIDEEFGINTLTFIDTMYEIIRTRIDKWQNKSGIGIEIPIQINSLMTWIPKSKTSRELRKSKNEKGKLILDSHGEGRSVDIAIKTADDAIEILKMLPDEKTYGIGLPVDTKGPFFWISDLIENKKIGELGLIMFASHIYIKMAEKEAVLKQEGKAYTYIKDSSLQKTLANLIEAKIIKFVYPDEEAHIHIETIGMRA